MTYKLNNILKNVDKPGRYIGGEYNTQDLNKPHDLSVCLCFPDLYEVGMSNQGIKILSEILNGQDRTICDYAFAPYNDFGKLIKENNISLMSLNKKHSLTSFDILGFSLQHEMNYTNILYMLDLAGISFLSEDRKEQDPLIIAGGPCMANPEPVAELFDLMVIGDGEKVIIQLTDLYKDTIKKNKKTRKEFLEKARDIKGVYVPSMLKINKNDSSDIVSFDYPGKVSRAICLDLDQTPYSTKQQVPNIKTVHDRAVIEIFRGCSRGCRFCQAGYTYRPVRNRSIKKITELSSDIIKNTGFDEISISSLSTGDYPDLNALLVSLKNLKGWENIKLSLPSLRLDSFKGDFGADHKKTSLTFAPEAGTQRLRDVINKNITEDDIMKSLKYSFKNGYSKVKLYFMIGLPTETMDDIDGIIKISRKIKDLYRDYRTSKKPLKLNISTSTLIPKPFTPFQWLAQIKIDDMRNKQYYLKDNLKKIGANYSYHDEKTSVIEAILARGDRSIIGVIIDAYRAGCKFDSWNDFFDFEKWMSAIKNNNIDIKKYTGEIDIKAKLPWDFIDMGIDKSFLIKEFNKSITESTTFDCRLNCLGCGLHKAGVCL